MDFVIWNQRRNRIQAKNTCIDRRQIRHFGSLFPFQFFQPEARRPVRAAALDFPPKISKRRCILRIPSKLPSLSTDVLFSLRRSYLTSRGLYFRSRALRSFKEIERLWTDYCIPFILLSAAFEHSFESSPSGCVEQAFVLS